MSTHIMNSCKLGTVLLPLGLAACAAHPAEERVGSSKAALSVSTEFRLVPSEQEPAYGGPFDIAFGAGEFMLLNSDNQGRVSDRQRVDRILPNGTNLDATGLPIGAPGYWSDWQSDGERFLALTASGGFPGSGSHPPAAGSLTIQRVTASGVPLDTKQIGSPGTREIRGSGMACGSGHCLVVWMTDEGIQSVWFRSGETLAASPATTLASGPLYGHGLAVAFDGTHYLVAANYSETWFTQRVDASGSKVDAVPRAQRSVSAWSAHLGSNGNGFLLLSSESTGEGAQLVAQRLSVQGDAQGSPITLGSGRLAVNSAVASDGSDYLVVWTQCAVYRGCDVHGARMDAAGTAPLVVRDYGRTVPPNEATPALAWGGGTYMAVWEEAPNGELFVRRFDPTGMVLDRQPVLPKWRAPVEPGPSVTWNGCSYLSAWFGGGMRGAFLAASGQPRQATSFLINDTSFPYLEQDRFLNVLGAPSGYLVHWRDGGQINTLRLDSTAVTLDEDAVALPDYLNPTDYAVTSQGDGWLFAWAELTGGSFGPTAIDLVGRRLSASGALGPKLTLSNAPGSQLAPSVAANGSEYFMVWHDLRAGDELWAKRLNADGAPLGNESRIGLTPRDSPLPVASDGSGYLVAWTDSSQQPARGVVRKFGANGAPESELAVLGAQLIPRHAIFDGRTFLVHYVDVSSEHFVRRVSSSGTLLDATGQRLDVPSVSGITSDGRGRTLVTYSRSDSRAWGKFIVADDAPPPLSASCEPHDAGVPDSSAADAGADAALPDGGAANDASAGVGGSAGTSGGHCSLGAPGTPSWMLAGWTLLGLVGAVGRRRGRGVRTVGRAARS